MSNDSSIFDKMIDAGIAGIIVGASAALVRNVIVLLLSGD